MKIKSNDFTWSWSKYIANIFGFKNKELTLKFKLNNVVIMLLLQLKNIHFLFIQLFWLIMSG